MYFCSTASFLLNDNTFPFQLSYNKSKQMQYNFQEGILDKPLCVQFYNKSGMRRVISQYVYV